MLQVAAEIYAQSKINSISFVYDSEDLYNNKKISGINVFVAFLSRAKNMLAKTNSLVIL